MKKIFLTSGIVVCMACPAFADFNASLYETTPGQELDLTQSGACENTHLGVYSGPTGLKAQWTPNDGTISFDNSISYTPQNCAANTPAATHSDATGPKYTTSGNQEGTFLANLYTRYGVGTYPTSEARGADTTGTNGMSSLISPSRAGYTFDGYYTHVSTTDPVTQEVTVTKTKYVNADGSFVTSGGDALLDTLIESANGTETLYAHWTPKTYTIGYNCGVLAALDDNEDPVAVTRENDAEDTTVTYDDCYSLATVASQCGTIPSGYTFGGWQCVKTTGTGDNATTTAFNLPGATKTLPASISAADLLGYPSAINAANMLYAETIVNNATVTVGGTWNVDLAADESVTCTAIWRANNISITWDGDGAENWSSSGATPSCTYDSDVTLPTEPSKTGYTFSGWAVDKCSNTNYANAHQQECQPANAATE